MSTAFCPSLAARPAHREATSVCRNFRGSQLFFSGTPLDKRRSFAGAQGSRKRALHVTNVSDVTQDSFEEDVLKSELPVLVDFWAEWCGPCKLILPCVEWAEQEYQDVLKVVKIETDGNPDLIEKYKIHGLPTIMLFKDGELVKGSRHEGAITRKLLYTYLEKRGVLTVKTQ
ncbi:hypothetical protein BSKO_00751 [Bryopsis sp. KO-2023]|nr:hypothetical protein BSKO_00751 [Bryopsis sp. KO-2023]